MQAANCLPKIEFTIEHNFFKGTSGRNNLVKCFQCYFKLILLPQPGFYYFPKNEMKLKIQKIKIRFSRLISTFFFLDAKIRGEKWRCQERNRNHEI